MLNGSDDYSYNDALLPVHTVCVRWSGIYDQGTNKLTILCVDFPDKDLLQRCHKAIMSLEL